MTRMGKNMSAALQILKLNRNSHSPAPSVCFALFKMALTPALFLLITALSIAFVNSAAVDSTRDGTVTVQLHENFQLSWLVSEDGKSVRFDAIAKTTGYVGIGFSSNGAMIGADIVIVGVHPGGTPYLHDMHGDPSENKAPIMDKVSNCDLISATENGTHTLVSFSRLLNTCDDEDMPITEANLRVIWSIGTADDQVYHGVASRGARSAYILDPEVPVPDLSHLQYFDINSTIKMPSRKTTYWCTIHQIAKFEGQRQMIAYDVLLPNEVSLRHAHHMNVLKCLHGFNPDKQYGPWVGHKGASCNSNLDEDGNVFPGETCLFLEYGWALGGEIAINPDDVGFPLISGQYLKLEVHLDNPENVEGLEVQVGFRVYYTEEPRPVQGSLIMVSAPVDFHQMIPPNSTEFVTTAHCMPTCTNIFDWPADGVTAYNAFLHAHTSATKMRIRHFRGSKELPWIINDENYNFNYQTNRRFPQPIKIMPGDQLTAECTYDTHWKKGLSVIGGQSTDDEMCMVFIAYYPKVPNFVGCQDAMTAKSIQKVLGIDKMENSGKDPIVLEPPNLNGKRVSKVVEEEVVWTQELRDEYQWLAQYGPHVGVCLPRINVYTAFYPHVEEYKPTSECLNEGPGGDNAAYRPSSSSKAGVFAVLVLSISTIFFHV